MSRSSSSSHDDAACRGDDRACHDGECAVPSRGVDGSIRVTALAMVNDDETRPPWRIITGGVDGRIRWAARGEAGSHGL